MWICSMFSIPKLIIIPLIVALFNVIISVLVGISLERHHVNVFVLTFWFVLQLVKMRIAV